MIHLSVFLIISLILPVLCRNPYDYGFTESEGNYYRNEDDPEGTTWMSINPDGTANYWRAGPNHGNGVGTIDPTRNEYLALGYGRAGLPLSGWEIPDRQPSGGYGQQTSSGGIDVNQRVANMRATAQEMQAMAHDTDNKQGDRRGGSSTGKSIIKNYGDYYTILYTKTKTNGNCEENIEIRGVSTAPTKAINEIFQHNCVAGRRAIHWQGPQMMVGNPNEDICVYGNADFSDQLVVIQDGVCTIKTYYSLTSSSTTVKTLEKDKCDTVKTLLQNKQSELVSGDDSGSDSTRQLKELVMKLSGTSGGDGTTASTPSGPTSTPVRVTQPGVTHNNNATPKKHGLLKRIWIFIKNIFRRIMRWPTKDE